MKDLKVSNETHSQLFSLKNKIQLESGKKLTYDEVLKRLLSYTMNSVEWGESMYQLEEKQ